MLMTLASLIQLIQQSEGLMCQSFEQFLGECCVVLATYDAV